MEPSFLIGNAKELILKRESIGSAIANFYNLMKRKSIPYGGFYFLTKPIFVPVDIELIKHIMIHDFDHFTGHLMNSFEWDPITKHIFALKGEPWKQLRQKLSPAFTPSKTKMTFPFVQKSVYKLIDLVNYVLKINHSVLEAHHLIVVSAFAIKESSIHKTDVVYSLKVKTMLSVLLVTITIISIVVLYFHVKKQLIFWKNKGVFTMEPGFLIGNAKELILKRESIGSAIANFYNLMKRKSIPYGGFYFLTKPIFVPVDIELIKHIMIHDFDHFTGHLMNSFEWDPITKHIFALKGEPWKQLRQKLSPAFTPSKTKMTFPFVQKSVYKLIDLVNSKLKTEGSVFEVDRLIVKCTADVTISTLFGLESNEFKGEDNEFQKVAEKFFEESFQDSIVRTLMFICPNLLDFFKIRSIPKNVQTSLLN
ncbi:hypothetical protein FQA39_LY16839 [Lamprigera yunnana]|nr:hypothetical protein FQA39_LY16839 [Lamprigera yunnana]